MTTPRIIELVEHKSLSLERDAISEELGETLFRLYTAQVELKPPSFMNHHQWGLTSLGWVGYLPVSDELHLALQPKVPLENLFGMLEYAYQVGKFLPDGLIQVESIQELYERLAHVLARRVLDRGRKGLYRSYISLDGRMPYVRGRMDARRLAQAPWDTRLHCHYQEHTADIEDNQILAWTLFAIARSGICTEKALPSVRQAFRQLVRLASLEPQPAGACLGRSYHRLNEDYEPLHALCHFFLENSGPTYHAGGRTMLPFLIDMAALFERFVAEWLQTHQIPGLRLQAHRRFTWDEQNGYHSDIDLVLFNASTGRPVCVLDTKYKANSTPAPADIYQVTFYAQAMGCREAVLIYPAPLASPTDTWIRDIHLRTLTFDIGGDLEEAGERFARQLVNPDVQESY